MNYIQQLERLNKLNRLIELGKTGSPEDLATSLEISKRQLFNLLETLKNLGAEIEYCKQAQSYRFQEAKIEINFSLKLIKKSESRKIYGGNTINIVTCNYISLCKNIFTPSSMMGEAFYP